MKPETQEFDAKGGTFYSLRDGQILLFIDRDFCFHFWVSPLFVEAIAGKP